MGIRGLNSYIQRERITGGTRTLTASEILTEIKAFRCEEFEMIESNL